MNNIANYETLETELALLYQTVPLSDVFTESLRRKITQNIRPSILPRKRLAFLRPALIFLAGFLIVLILTTLIIGPSKVYAEMRRLLGYIPGVGVVDTTSPIRVLAEPVEQTRDGVTITVTSATLTVDRTQIDYRIFGVPRSAYPDREDVPGCLETPYLQFADGNRLNLTGNTPPVPADVNQATLVIPCIANTLSGTTPENWQIPLKFIPAPPDFTVMPVIEITPTQTLTPPPDAAGQSENNLQEGGVTVSQEIETKDGYILVGQFAPKTQPGEFVQTTGMPVFTDAAGRNVPIQYPEDINSLQTGINDWALEFNAIGVQFPLTIVFPGVIISRPDADAQVEVPFDFGETVTSGQEWQPDLMVELAGHSIKLTAISADSRGGYSFHFKTDPEVYGVSVQIKGYSPNGGGGGGGGGLTNGDTFASLSYAQRPTGKVTLVLSNLTLISEPLFWQTAWSPSTPRTDLPATYALPAGTCGNMNTLQSIPDLPSTFSGKVLVYEQLPDGDDWGLVLYNLNGSGRTLVKALEGWGALSQDGNKVTYPVEGGFEIYDVATGSVTPWSGSGGYNPAWSHNGRYYAFVQGAAEGVSVMDLNTGEETVVSTLGYETVIGWLPDDSRLIIAAMYSGGVARQIRSVDPQTGAYEELFEIEDASVKALNAALSPDGQWLAYRGRDNGSVRLIKMDGSQERLLLDSPAAGISGIAWSGNGWMGVSLMQYNPEAQKLILIDPQNCTVYKVPGLTGTLLGLFVR